MEMNDEMAGLRAVDGGLRLGAPRARSARVIGKDADHVDLGGVAKFIGIEAFQLAAEYEMQELLGLLGGRGVDIRVVTHLDFPIMMRRVRHLGRVAPLEADEALTTCIAHASGAPIARRPASTNGPIIVCAAPNKAPCRVCSPMKRNGRPAASTSLPPAPTRLR